MFPYGSQKLSATSDLKLAGRSYLEVERAVATGLSDASAANERIGKLAEMSGYSGECLYRRLYTSFELKLSKSSGMKTLYVFEYLVANVDTAFEPSVEGVWVRADSYSSSKSEIEALADSHNMSVERNVFDALKNALE